MCLKTRVYGRLYNQKYQQELSLALGPKISIAKVLVGSILVDWYMIAIILCTCIYTSTKINIGSYRLIFNLVMVTNSDFQPTKISIICTCIIISTPLLP